MRWTVLLLLLLASCDESAAPGPSVTDIPIADFAVLPLSGDAPLIVSCQNLTTPTDAEMHWMFSDGGISNDLHPMYVFEQPGIYSVVLIATNSAGASDMVVAGIEVFGTVPPPPPGGFPQGPDELQNFIYTGNNEVISYTAGVPTDFHVPVFIYEDGVPGTPSQLNGFSASLNYDFDTSPEDFATAIDVEWSDWVMALNGGDGPDLVIGGVYPGNEINVGAIATTALPADYWYLPEGELVELIRVNFTTIPLVILDQELSMNFYIEDSVTTNATNCVGVNMPLAGATCASIPNGHLSAGGWAVELIP